VTIEIAVFWDEMALYWWYLLLPSSALKMGTADSSETLITVYTILHDATSQKTVISISGCYLL
jgi:hypothetical protein